MIARARPDITVATYARLPLSRIGLRAALAEAPGIMPVAEMAVGSQLDEILAKAAPDVVVAEDLGAGQELLGLVRRVRQFGRGNVGVVMLTDLAVGEHTLEYLRAGADALVLRDGPLSDVVTAVRTVAAGGALITPPLARILVDLMVRRIPQTTPAAGISALTPRERETLTLLAAGMSNQEIARAMFLSVKTVKFHVSNLLSKLGLRDRAQAIVYARDGAFSVKGLNAA